MSLWSFLDAALGNRRIGDFNMHLSNSSYAKVSARRPARPSSTVPDPRTPPSDRILPRAAAQPDQNLDPARMKACVELFSPFFPPGGWMALGGELALFVRGRRGPG